MSTAPRTHQCREWSALSDCAQFLIERADAKHDAGDTESAYQIYASAAAMFSHGALILGIERPSDTELHVGLDARLRATETAARAGMRSC